MIENMVCTVLKPLCLWDVPTIHINVYVCVCVCVTGRACFVIYEDTNLYNDKGMTQVLRRR